MRLPKANIKMESNYVPMRLGSRERACFACNECQIEQRCMETIKACAHWSPVYWFSARKRWTELPSKESKPFVSCACFLDHKINLAFDAGEYPFKTWYILVRKRLTSKNSCTNHWDALREVTKWSWKDQIFYYNNNGKRCVILNTRQFE